MANNRLYLVDTETGERMLLAKGYCNGWGIWPESPDIEAWLDERDMTCAMGDPRKTTLVLIAENSEEFRQYDPTKEELDKFIGR